MATLLALPDDVTLVRHRKGVYHLRIKGVGDPGPDGTHLGVTCTLNGELGEPTLQGVIDLVLSQKTKRGIYCKEDSFAIVGLAGCTVQRGSFRTPAKNVADALSILASSCKE